MKTAREYLNKYGGMLYTVFTVLAVIGLIYFFFIPKYEEIKSLRVTIALQEKEASELRTYLAYLVELANSTLAIEQDIIDYALPSDNDVISFIVTYEGLGKFPGVALQPLSITPGLVSASRRRKEMQPTDASEVIEVINEPKRFDFNLNAMVTSEEMFKDFITEIYNTRRFIDIHSTKIMFGDDGKLDLSMAASTYYLPPFTVKSSSYLVKKGKDQIVFFDKLKNSNVYENLVLDGVSVGKTDLFNY